MKLQQKSTSHQGVGKQIIRAGYSITKPRQRRKTPWMILRLQVWRGGIVGWPSHNVHHQKLITSIGTVQEKVASLLRLAEDAAASMNNELRVQLVKIPKQVSAADCQLGPSMCTCQQWHRCSKHWCTQHGFVVRSISRAILKTGFTKRMCITALAICRQYESHRQGQQHWPYAKSKKHLMNNQQGRPLAACNSLQIRLMRLSEFQEKHEGDLTGPALEEIKNRPQALKAQFMPHGLPFLLAPPCHFCLL